MSELPSGTITFLFTDIEGSTPLWERDAEAMKVAVARHHAILHQAAVQHGGHVFKIIGDEFQIAFELPAQALQAALTAQHYLQEEPWGSSGPLRVRMGLHTGPASLVDSVFNTTDYAVSHTLNRVARIRSAGHGGQILLSAAVMELLRGQMPQDVSLLDMGEHHLKGLQQPEHIFQVIAPGLERDFPALKTLDSQPNNLPVQATHFIGRQAELAAVCKQLEQPEVRLLTLTGPGGAGKTRLGLQVAADMLEEFTGGVYFVALASINNPDLVVPAIARALRVREQGNLPILDCLKNTIRDQHILLLLDNFEQVAGAAGVVSELLEACPNLKILVTSRVVLRLYGEHDFTVPPLSLPDRKYTLSADRITQYEAVRLFIERAQAIRPSFNVTNENAPAVAEICHRLDGLPLAIELAAARASFLSPQAILGWLEHRLTMLTGGAKNLPARQQTLRKTIDWSFELLEPAEQEMFARLSVFVGGFTLDAVQAVAGELCPSEISVLDCLTRLVDNSLLSHMESQAGDEEPRLTILEILREYAQEKMVEKYNTWEQIQERHAGYFLGLAEEAMPKLEGPQQVDWFTKLELEYENFRTALDWTHHSHQLEIMARLCISLTRYWYLHGYPSEGRKWIGLLLNQVNQLSVAHQARLLTSAGVLASAQADNTNGKQYFEQSLILQRQLGDKRGIADALNGLGSVALDCGEYQHAVDLYSESLVFQRELGDTWGIARVLNNLGLTEFNRGYYDQATVYLKESLELSRQIQDISIAAYALLNLGRMALFQGQPIQSKEWLEQSLELQQQLGNKRGVSIALVNLGQLAVEYGDPAKAIDLCQKSLAICREVGDKRGEGFAYMFLAEAAFGIQQYSLSVDFCQHSIPLLKEAGDLWSLACCLNDLGRAKVELKEYTQALEHFQESLRIWKEVDDAADNTVNVIGVATVLIAQNQYAQAINLLSSAAHYRETMKFPFSPNYQKYIHRYVAVARDGFGESAFTQAWEIGSQMTYEQSLAEACSVGIRDRSSAG
jgi:predicted ATPase/class 3 adenylate cyclase